MKYVHGGSTLCQIMMEFSGNESTSKVPRQRVETLGIPISQDGISKCVKKTNSDTPSIWKTTELESFYCYYNFKKII